MRLERKRLILVVSVYPELAEITRRATEGDIAVDYASNEIEGMARIRQNHPDIIILGQLKTRQTESNFYQALREGWISRHASLLVVVNVPGDSPRVLNESDFQLGTGEYSF
jgi:DNA-binding response OmpR family regulator